MAQAKLWRRVPEASRRRVMTSRKLFWLVRSPSVRWIASGVGWVTAKWAMPGRLVLAL